MAGLPPKTTASPLGNLAGGMASKIAGGMMGGGMMPSISPSNTAVAKSGVGGGSYFGGVTNQINVPQYPFSKGQIATTTQVAFPWVATFLFVGLVVWAKKRK